MMRVKKKRQKGFSMIEMIIYLSLFASIVGSSVLTFYQVSESNTKLNSEISLLKESEFILSKINWLIRNYDKLNKPIKNQSSEILSLDKNNSSILVYSIDEKIFIEEDGDISQISSNDFKVKNLFFESLDLTGNSNFFGLKASFEINDQRFETIRIDYVK